MCFILGVTGTNREVSLDLKHGVEAKSYEDVSLFFKLFKAENQDMVNSLSVLQIYNQIY